MNIDLYIQQKQKGKVQFFKQRQDVLVSIEHNDGEMDYYKVDIEKLITLRRQNTEELRQIDTLISDYRAFV